MGNKWRWVIYGVVVLVIAWGLYSLNGAKNQMKGQASDTAAQLSKTNKENQDLEDQIDYFKNPANLVNKLKEQTSYRLPDEKLIIITSGATSTQSTSTGTSTK